MKKIIAVLMIIIVASAGVGFWYFQKYDKPEYVHKGFWPTTTLKPIWERKIQTEQDVKIGIITDTHVHAKRIERQNKSQDAPRYLSEKYIRPLNQFNEQMKIFQPELIFHLGDVIEGTNDEDYIGKMGIDLTKNELEKTGVPVYWAVGNHDLRSVTKEQFREVIGIENENQVIDYGDYRFIIADANFYPDGSESVPGHSSIGGYMPEQVSNWLEEQLKTDKQVFIFIHHPLFTDRRGIFNAAEIEQMLIKYNVKAVFHGHIETKLYLEKEGVKQYSLTGTKKSKEYPESYYELRIKAGEPQIQMFYTDPNSGEKVEVSMED
jgi:Icc-related predicted phosphoesterase